jgi:hypothetical protein
MADTYHPGMEFQSWRSLPSISKTQSGLASKLLGMALDATGIKDLLNGGGSSNVQSLGVPPPAQAQNQYQIGPAIPAPTQGINPLRLPTAPAGGVGMVAQPMGIPPTSFFNGPSNPFATQQQFDPNAKHVGEIVQAWDQ